MKYDRVIEQALREAQDLLWANLPPTHELPDDQAVKGIRALVCLPSVEHALERGNDTVCAFALRAVHRVLSEQAASPRVTVCRLWDILDEPHLNRALGRKQNSRMNFRVKKPPAG